jgi:hypothetical protein
VEDAEASVAFIVIAVRSGCIRMLDLLEYFRIEHRRADSITAACPFPQIDQPATITAEREELV